MIVIAQERDARALEGWPLAAGKEVRPADAFVGREELFAELGFRRIADPIPGRVIMRRDFNKGGG